MCRFSPVSAFLHPYAEVTTLSAPHLRGIVRRSCPDARMLTGGPAMCANMAGVTLLPRHGVRTRPRLVSPSVSPFFSISVSLVVHLCLLPICLGFFTTAEAAPALGACAAVRHYAWLVCFLSGAVLDAKLLPVLGMHGDWPNTHLELEQLELNHVDGEAASGRNMLGQNAHVEEALTRIPAGRSNDDEHDDETKSFPSEPKGEGAGAVKRVHGHSPVSSASVYGKSYKDVNPLNSSASDGEYDGRRRNTPKRQKNEPQGEPQSHLDDEPQPWKQQKEEPEERVAVAENGPAGPSPDRSTAVGKDSWRAGARAFFKDEKGDSDDETDTGEDAAEEEEEEDSEDENILDSEDEVFASESAADRSSSAATTENDEQSLKNWRDLVRTVAGRDQPFANPDIYFGLSRTEVNKKVRKQLTAAERVKTAKPTDEAKPGAVSEEEKVSFIGERDFKDSFAERLDRKEVTSLIRKTKQTEPVQGSVLRVSPGLTRDMSAEEGFSEIGLSQKQHNVWSPQEPTDTEGKVPPVAAATKDQVVAGAASTTEKRGNGPAALVLDKNNTHVSSADDGRRTTAVTPVAAAAAKAAAAEAAVAAAAGAMPVQNASLAPTHENKADAGASREQNDGHDTSSRGSSTAAFVASSGEAAATPRATPELPTWQTSTAPTTGVPTAAVRPTAPSAGAAYTGSHTDSVAAGSASAGAQTPAAGIRMEGADITVTTVVLGENLTATNHFGPTYTISSDTVQGAPLPRPVASQPAATLKPWSTAAVGPSAAQLLVGPLVAGTPSFIGAAAAVPPDVGTGPASVHAATGAAGDKDGCEECKKLEGREQLRAVFEEISEAGIEAARKGNALEDVPSTAVKEEVVEARTRAAKRGPAVNTARDSTGGDEERKEHVADDASSLFQREAATAAAEEEFAAEQRSEDAATKTAASTKDTGGTAAEHENNEEENDEAEAGYLTGDGAAIATLQKAKRRPLRMEAGLPGAWEEVERQEKNPEAHHRSSSNVLTWPRVQNQQRQQQQQQQHETSSRIAGEAAGGDPNTDSDATLHRVPADEPSAYQEFPVTHNLANDSPSRRPFGRSQQTQQHARPPRHSTTYQPQPNTSEIPQYQHVSFEEQEQNGNQEDYQLPKRLLSEQQRTVGLWELERPIAEETEQQQEQPTSAPQYPVPQQPHVSPEQVQQQGRRHVEEVPSNNTFQPAEPTRDTAGDEFSHVPSHVSEEQQRQQRQQQPTQKMQQQQQPGLSQVYTDERDATKPSQRSAGGLVHEPGDTLLWREIERRSDAYDRARGVPVSENTLAASRCMAGDHDMCVEAVLQRHCDSWCTAEALKKWDGQRPVWMSLHLIPLPTYWNCVKEGWFILYEQHRPSVDRLLLQGLRALKQLRTQVEGNTHLLLGLAAARSQQFQQQHPDLWLGAAWLLAVLLLCRLLTGRFFFLLQLLLSATACVFGCRRRAPAFPGDSQYSLDGTAVATAQALLADKQIKWLFTQTKKTSFLCEQIKGRLADGTLVSLPPAGASPAAGTSSSVALARRGGPAGGSGGTATGAFGYGDVQGDDRQRPTGTQQEQHQQIVGLLQQIIRDQQQTAHVLRGVQQRVELMESRQRLYENKLQEAAAGYSAMFETNSLQQVDTNYAVLKLITQVLQKLDREITAEIVEPLEAAFFAHMDTVNEAVAAIKARQLRALFGHVGTQAGGEAQEEAAIAATTAGVQGLAPVSAGGFPFRVAGHSHPHPAALHVTATASLSITSGPAAGALPSPVPAAAPTVEDAGAGLPAPAAAAAALMLTPRRSQQEHPREDVAVTPPAFGDTERNNLPWILRQLWHIQRSLPELMLQRGEFQAQLLLTRKTGDTQQQIVVRPEETIFNSSDSVGRALGPVSAAVNQVLLASSACRSNSSMSTGSRGSGTSSGIPSGGSAVLTVGTRSSPAPSPGPVIDTTSSGLPAALSTLSFTKPRVAPQQQQQLASEAHGGTIVSRDAAAPPAAVSVSCNPDGTPSNISSSLRLPPPTTVGAGAAAAGIPSAAPSFASLANPRSGDLEGKSRGTAAEAAGAGAPEAAALRETTAETAGTGAAAGGATLPSADKGMPFSPAKQQAARRSTAALFGDTAESHSHRSSLGERFSPHTSVLPCPPGGVAVKAVSLTGGMEDSVENFVGPTGGLPPLASGDSAGGGPVSSPPPSGAAPLFAGPSDGATAEAGRAAVTPHFPPADPSALNPESPAAAPLLPSPSQSTPHSPRMARAGPPSSLLSSPFSGPAVGAAGPLPSSSGLLPSLPSGSATQTPALPVHSTSANGPSTVSSRPSLLTCNAGSTSLPSSPPALPPSCSSVEEAPPTLPHGAHFTPGAAASSPPFVRRQAESGDPQLLNTFTSVAANSAILSSPPAPSRSHAAIAASTATGSSPPFPYNREAPAAAPPHVAAPSTASASPHYDPYAAATAKESRRGSRDELLLSNGVEASSSFPPPPSAFPQPQPAAAEADAAADLPTGAAKAPSPLPPLQTGGPEGGTTPPPLQPPARTTSSPLMPPPGGGGAEASPPPTLSPPSHAPSVQIPNERASGGGGASRAAMPDAAAEALEGGSLPTTPLAPSPIPSGNNTKATTFSFFPPPAFRGNGYPHPPPSSGSLPPTGRTTAYQRPTRFPRERREIPKIQAATNPFGFAAPPSGAGVALQQLGGGGDDGGAASTHDAA